MTKAIWATCATACLAVFLSCCGRSIAEKSGGSPDIANLSPARGTPGEHNTTEGNAAAQRCASSEFISGMKDALFAGTQTLAPAGTTLHLNVGMSDVTAESSDAATGKIVCAGTLVTNAGSAQAGAPVRVTYSATPTSSGPYHFEVVGPLDAGALGKVDAREWAAVAVAFAAKRDGQPRRNTEEVAPATAAPESAAAAESEGSSPPG